MLRGRLVFENVIVDSPKFVIVQRKDGSWKTPDMPADLQAAILKAGKEAGVYGRQIESSEDQAKLDALAKANKLTLVPFKDRAAMQKAVDPVMAAYAKEIGAEAIFARINSIQ